MEKTLPDNCSNLLRDCDAIDKAQKIIESQFKPAENVCDHAKIAQLFECFLEEGATKEPNLFDKFMSDLNAGFRKVENTDLVETITIDGVKKTYISYEKLKVAAIAAAIPPGMTDLQKELEKVHTCSEAFKAVLDERERTRVILEKTKRRLVTTGSAFIGERTIETGENTSGRSLKRKCKQCGTSDPKCNVCSKRSSWHCSAHCYLKQGGECFDPLYKKDIEDGIQHREAMIRKRKRDGDEKPSREVKPRFEAGR